MLKKSVELAVLELCPGQWESGQSNLDYFGNEAKVRLGLESSSSRQQEL